jgi:hypothetical protein
MPDGGAWTGVYYSQVYGFLHLISEGKSANGAWRTKAGSEWGELAGEVDGNLFRYSWTNHRIGQVGVAANSSGKGYFVYSIPKAGEAHQIAGEWGLGQDETGNTWDAIKQMNMEPDPDSVKPDEIEGRVQAGGWDEGETEEATDESGETSGDEESEEEPAE